MQNDKDFLGTEPVGKLLMKLAIPTVTAQIINMLYNIDVYKRQVSISSEGRLPL